MSYEYSEEKRLYLLYQKAAETLRDKYDKITKNFTGISLSASSLSGEGELCKLYTDAENELINMLNEALAAYESFLSDLDTCINEANNLAAIHNDRMLEAARKDGLEYEG